MKLARVLILALGLVMIAAIPTLANVPFITSSTLNQMAPNAETGLSGNLVLTALTGGTISAGEIINVTYAPNLISSLTDASAAVVIAPATIPASTIALAGAAFGVPQVLPVAGVTVTVYATYVQFSFSALTAFAAGDTIQLNGIRLDVHNGGTLPPLGTEATVTFSSVLGSATLTNTAPVPVAIYVAPIQISATPLAFSEYNTAPVTQQSTITISEAGAFTNAFETKGTGDATEVILNISNFEAGASLTGVVTSTINLIPNSFTTSSVGVTATLDTVDTNLAAGKVVVYINSQNPNTIDSIYVPVQITEPATILLNPPIGSACVVSTNTCPLNVTATLGPALSPLTIYPIDVATTNLWYSSNTTPTTIPIVVSQALTALLAVFNAYVPGFDTGFAVANTTGYLTAVPGQTFIGGSVLAQSGTVTVVLYPQYNTPGGPVPGTPVAYNTATNPKLGTGLDSMGNVPAAGTWTVTLSSLCKQLGLTSFVGQAYFFTNFSNAHGVNYIADSNFAVQAQGYAMEVIPNPAARPNPEALDQ